ncbi:MAG: HAD-IB family hydrolase [Oscillospiraceae bacterium]|nr:HAD-IB family hydrolase [Oscillospiraceae bacterium]
MERLAIFDVDYTLTKSETQLELFLFMLKKNPKLIVHAFRCIYSALFYILRIYTAKKAKESFLRFINGIEEKDMQDLVKEFYDKRLISLIYDDAMRYIKKCKNDGYKIYLISASYEFYLNELYKIKEVDRIIGTKIKMKDGKYSNLIDGENCKGEEKVKRLLLDLKENNIDVDFKNSMVFSDSLSDLPLFNLVGKAYLINYNKKHANIEILKWR